MAADQTTSIHMMFSPKTNTIMNMLQGALHPKKPTATVFKTIHIGTDKLSVRILEIYPINGKSWKKKSYLLQ